MRAYENPITQEMIDELKSTIKVGSTVTTIATLPDDGRRTAKFLQEEKVIGVYPNFALTDKGARLWADLYKTMFRRDEVVAEIIEYNQKLKKGEVNAGKNEKRP